VNVLRGLDVGDHDVGPGGDVVGDARLRLFDHQVDVLQEPRLRALDEPGAEGQLRTEPAVHDVEVQQLEFRALGGFDPGGQVHQVDRGDSRGDVRTGLSQ